jgi:hypothetical protein
VTVDSLYSVSIRTPTSPQLGLIAGRRTKFPFTGLWRTLVVALGPLEGRARRSEQAAYPFREEERAPDGGGP